jgi:hypothetical protein
MSGSCGFAASGAPCVLRPAHGGNSSWLLGSRPKGGAVYSALCRVFWAWSLFSAERGIVANRRGESSSRSVSYQPRAAFLAGSASSLVRADDWSLMRRLAFQESRSTNRLYQLLERLRKILARAAISGAHGPSPDASCR